MKPNGVPGKMMAVLADGLPHKREELHACLNDTLAPLTNIAAHLTYIRKHLRPKGMDVLCQLTKGGIFYRQVRLLSPNDE